MVRWAGCVTVTCTRSRLTLKELQALQKVFEDDTSIAGMMEVRQVAEHVIRRDGPVIRTVSNVPIQLTAESSALAMPRQCHIE